MALDAIEWPKPLTKLKGGDIALNQFSFQLSRGRPPVVSAKTLRKNPVTKTSPWDIRFAYLYSTLLDVLLVQPCVSLGMCFVLTVFLALVPQQRT